MRDPEKLNITETIHPTDNVIVLKNIPVYDIEDWDLNDSKEFKRYVDTVEKCVRTSLEYKQMINYLKENLHMNQCSFLENINNTDFSKVKIEIHHDPLSLFDIASIVTRKRIFFAEPLDEELTAKEIMLCHYNFMVGLIPLSETVHDLVHKRYLFIPTSKLFGNYKVFIEYYKDFILPEQMEALQNIEEATSCYDNSQYKDILEKKYIYIDLDGGRNTLPTTQDIKKLLSNKVELLEKPNKDKKLKTLYVLLDKTSK